MAASDLDVIGRALQLKDALQLYRDHCASEDTGRLDKDECLTAEDWHERSRLKQLLRPLEDASKRCQATPVDGHSTTERLLSKFEELKRQPFSEYLHICINLGWKLDKCYELSDSLPDYIIAVFLHQSHQLA